MVFYRKYRPQTIDQLDLISVREKLKAILRSSFEAYSHMPPSASLSNEDWTQSIPHAFLFTGPKGLGKTSSARILAKAINCERRSADSGLRIDKKKNKKATRSQTSDICQIEPCNKCDACISITNGSNIDVLEIDAASNRGIDEIRELRERVKFAPASIAKKVYIIDEVHMLTNEAFNALLKILEEPPRHVVFILCTTEYWKLPTTIVSRAFHVQFEKPTCEEITRSLKRVVDGEGLTLDDKVYKKLFTLCDGAFRDGTKILEELARAAPDKKITLELLERVYKTDSIDLNVQELLLGLVLKNLKKSLQAIQNFANQGCDFKIVIEKMVDALRQELLAAQRIQDSKFKNHESDLSIMDIEKLLELCSDAYKNLKLSVIPQLPLELLAVKWCVLEDEKSKIKNQINDEVNHSSSEVEKLPQNNTNESSHSVRAITIPANRSNKIALLNSISAQESKENARNDDVNESAIQNGDDQFLKTLIEKIKKENFSIAGILRSVRLGKMADSGVELIAPFKFHGERLQEGKILQLLERQSAEILGKHVKIIVRIKESN